MALMQSCCCWRSVRRGSFACAVYTVLYYSVLAVTIATVLQEESQYLAGNRSLPKSNSVLEEEVSPTTMRFNIALLICSSCGVICCLLLLYGLFKDEKIFLVPWICIVILCSFVDIAHLLYLFIVVSLAFNPITAMVLTIDFFLLCLNVYSVLCVISQYQEYAAGRGTASDDCEHRVPAVRYTIQPTTTATSCLSSRRGGPTNETRVTATTATPTQSPTAVPAQLTIERSPSAGDRAGRKHVQFIPETTMTTSTITPSVSLSTDEALAAQLKDGKRRSLAASVEPRNGHA